ncbi:MAG: OsmC family protein [Bacteroidetes bacterium]|nr:OsmC family protein [Bacteroidota bacterium]
MTTSKISYKGHLRTECTHLGSGSVIVTDAPVDNSGKGEAFSPTDTVATSLASCMITMMGIKAGKEGWDINGTSAEVTKIMASDPRRISGIQVHLRVVDNGLSNKNKIILERIARNCPVAKSLHPDVHQDIQIEFV